MALGLSDAYGLMLAGGQALAQVSANGMMMDVPYLDQMIVETGEKIQAMEEELRKDDIWSMWKKIYGVDANLGSGDQLGDILFDKLKIPCGSRTRTGKPSTDADSLERIDHPFIRKLTNMRKLERTRSTNLIGLRREQVGGILRPSFNLHTVSTYRSSSSDPNSQNIPIRDKKVSLLVRRAFIPRPGYTLVEFDLKSAEVRVSCCYHADPTMVEYIARDHDYHMDLACQCFLLEKEQVISGVRGVAKGDFVFASFYGDYYKQIAANLWDSIARDGLKRTDGMPLYQHLKASGIKEFGDPESDDHKVGTFLYHIKRVFDDFWGRRFKVYSDWKEQYWRQYLNKGWIQTLTGFVCRAPMEKNQCINFPIQGSSFHCLLWSLIKIHDWLKAGKMRSMIIGQIHDSILMDVHNSEFDYVIPKCRSVIYQDIRREWDWITVPLSVEAGKSDRNWYEKKAFELPA